MRKIYIMALALFSSLAFATAIDVSVDDRLSCEISSLVYNASYNITEFPVELYNTGSIGYKARARVDIIQDEIIFTGWSKEKALMPGEKKIFPVYWYNEKGNYTLRVRAYFGNEILEHTENFTAEEASATEDVFKILGFRTYDSYVLFDIKSSEDVREVVVIPKNYLPGWVFEQERISFGNDDRKTVLINYLPAAWQESTVTIEIVSADGRYYKKESFKMEKEQGLLWFFYAFLDSFRILSLMY